MRYISRCYKCSIEIGHAQDLSAFHENSAHEICFYMPCCCFIYTFFISFNSWHNVLFYECEDITGNDKVITIKVSWLIY